jgi:exodeoxyribonuclease VII large subunit
MRVVVSGSLTIYEPRGVYQLVASRIEPAGVGELHAAFERLKEHLAREGLFATERKRRLPFLPRCIGVISSPSGAALQDFLRVVLQRHPKVWIRFIPVRVQGAGAAEDIARALDAFQRPEPQADVLVLTRGGGSLEDLWAFNEEVVARAIARSRIPTVSAVGHEVDFTISDFVADRRAATPTAAGECVVPALETLCESLEAFRRRLTLGLTASARDGQAALARLVSSGSLRDPHRHLQRMTERLDDRTKALKNGLYNHLERADDDLLVFRSRLETLNPFAVLDRGYAVVTDSQGALVHSSESLAPGDRVRIRFARGAAKAVIEETVIEETVIEETVIEETEQDS